MQEFIDTLINGPARYTQEHHFSPGWALVNVIAVLLVELGAVYILAILFLKAPRYSRSFFSFVLRRLGVGKRQPEYTFLQLSLPANTSKSAYATEQLHTLLRSTVKYAGFWDRMAARKQPYSLEIVATHDGGIRYLIRIPKQEAEATKRTLLSFLPGLRINNVDDYLPRTIQSGWGIAELKLAGDFVIPLADRKTLEEHDPAAYLTGHMRKLSAEELVAFQIVVVPLYDNTHPNELRHILDIQRHIAMNEQVGQRLDSYKINVLRILSQAILIPFRLINRVRRVIISTISILLGYGSMNSDDRWTGSNPYEQELARAIKTKLDQPLFEVSMRILVMSPDGESTYNRLYALQSSFNTFAVTNQSLTPHKKALFTPSSLWLRRFRNRELLRHLTSQQTVLSSSELSDLYHFPAAQTSTENMTMSLSRTLAPPLSLINNPSYDIELGRNTHRGAYTSIGLTAKEREKHVFVVGGTGNGKTTMLQYGLVQDTRNGKGVAVIDPHGDLAESLLRYIPKEREKDVVYFNPDDLSYPIGLNLLELTPGLSEEDALRERDLVTESVISIFRKIFSEDDTGGHRIEYVLRNAIQTALTVEDATLFTVYNLLNDPDYCKTVTQTLKNEDLQNFWKNELGKAGNFQQVKMVSGITAKIGRFLFSASAKRILEQPRSTINFDEILNGKILICNFSKGLLGEDTSELFGIAVLAKIQIAALRRARVKQAERRPFYLYVDEFQNFATMSFVQMLSEARKYKLFLVMAEQSTSQQDDQKMVNIILANVGTVVCFRTGSAADERLMLPLFKPYIEDGDIANLPPFNFYMRISATKPQEAFSGETLLLDDVGSEEAAERVIGHSRIQYGKRYVPPVKKRRAAKEETVHNDGPSTQGKDRVKVIRKAQSKTSGDDRGQVVR